jgi:hypothetical protein
MSLCKLGTLGKPVKWRECSVVNIDLLVQVEDLHLDVHQAGVQVGLKLKSLS